MKKQRLIAGACMGVMLLSGCSSTTIFDPTKPEENTVRAIGTVSQAECYIATQAAVADVMSDPGFERFLANYRQQHGADKVPLMQVGALKNDTNDPELKINLVTDDLCNELRKSGKVEVTLATGRDKTPTMKEARQLKDDPDFDQTTVVKQGTLIAPVLSMEGAILSNVVRDGRDTVQVYSFNLKLADIVTGKVIWNYNKPVGTKKTKGWFGL